MLAYSTWRWEQRSLAGQDYPVQIFMEFDIQFTVIVTPGGYSNDNTIQPEVIARSQQVFQVLTASIMDVYNDEKGRSSVGVATLTANLRH